MGVSYHGGFDSQVREETLKCLVIINIYSFINWFPPQSSAHLKNQVIWMTMTVVLMMMMMIVMLCQCFLYDLETSLFSFYMYISDIFSQSVVYIFVLLSVSHCKKKFLTFINYKYKSYIMVRSSGVLRNPCVPENHDDFLFFSLEVL